MNYKLLTLLTRLFIVAIGIWLCRFVFPKMWREFKADCKEVFGKEKNSADRTAEGTKKYTQLNYNIKEGDK